jgi:hypothetical protein
MSAHREWQSVPEDRVTEWQVVFHSAETMDVSGACPVCNFQTLHQWFDRPRLYPIGEGRPGFLGRGGSWQWCSSCYSYEHYSGLVPDWWRDTFDVDYEALTHCPEAIEVARLRDIGANSKA